MEEDIKILEDFIKYFEAEAISTKYRRNISITVGEDDIQAIDNLIKGYRELEEENSRIEYIEKETINNPNPQDWDTKGLYTIRYHKRIDVIQKSKIKEKIEELEKEKDVTYTKFLAGDRKDEFLSTKGKMLEGAIQVLQELMEDK